jgi:hypothetical protein
MKQSSVLGTTSSTTTALHRRSDVQATKNRRGSLLEGRPGLVLAAACVLVMLAGTACTLAQRRKELVDSYRLAQYRLEQCLKMGAAKLDPGRVESATSLSIETEALLTAGHWYSAERDLTSLEDVLAVLIVRLKEWDPDGDGLSTYAEFMLYGTSWSDPDTDGDGYLDGSEVLVYQTDPLDPCSVPMGIQPERARTKACPALDGLESHGSSRDLPAKKE